MAMEFSRKRFQIFVGAKGRLVLPADLRKAIHLQPGDTLLATLDADGSIRVVKDVDPIKFFSGRYKALGNTRSVVDDLIAERIEDNRRDEEEGL